MKTYKDRNKELQNRLDESLRMVEIHTKSGKIDKTTSIKIVRAINKSSLLDSKELVMNWFK